jgi:ankyrin repeat protein
MGSIESNRSKSESPLMTLPNELFFEVASYLEGFKDLNSLLRATRLLRTLFNPLLYRRAVAADDTVREDIVSWVISRYRATSLRLLLDNGLSIDQRPSKYWPDNGMLRLLCAFGHDECSVPMARLLIERGADTDAKDPRDAATVLHVAARAGAYGIAELLLAHGADVNAADKNGNTSLHHASKQNAGMVNLLIAHGAAVNAPNNDGDTPLLLTNWSNYRAVMPVLLAHGADAGAHNNNGMTPLHEAARYFVSDDHELAKSLLEHGAAVNATDKEGLTPLHWATKSHSPQRTLFMVKFLLENGAEVNAL